MTAIIIIAIIIFIIYTASSKKKPTQQNTTQQNTTYTNPNNKQKSEKEIRDELVQSLIKNIKVTVTTSSSTSNYNDDSIIDVTDQSYKINSNSNLKKYSNGVPYWAHHYVYSYSEINSASSEQKKFYAIFKNSFLDGEYF
ncbi:hypothetical protein JE954_001939, partial [Flavobacterium psychrophilum]|nr:hypothetical protein [Flavobacterium psychrophilum]